MNKSFLLAAFCVGLAAAPAWTAETAPIGDAPASLSSIRMASPAAGAPNVVSLDPALMAAFAQHPKLWQTVSAQGETAVVQKGGGFWLAPKAPREGHQVFRLDGGQRPRRAPLTVESAAQVAQALQTNDPQAVRRALDEIFEADRKASLIVPDGAYESTLIPVVKMPWERSFFQARLRKSYRVPLSVAARPTNPDRADLNWRPGLGASLRLEKGAVTEALPVITNLGSRYPGEDATGYFTGIVQKVEADHILVSVITLQTVFYAAIAGYGGQSRKELEKAGWRPGGRVQVNVKDDRVESAALVEPPPSLWKKLSAWFTKGWR